MQNLINSHASALSLQPELMEKSSPILQKGIFPSVDFNRIGFVAVSVSSNIPLGEPSSKFVNVFSRTLFPEKLLISVNAWVA